MNRFYANVAKAFALSAAGWSVVLAIAMVTTAGPHDYDVPRFAAGTPEAEARRAMVLAGFACTTFEPEGSGWRVARSGPKIVCRKDVPDFPIPGTMELELRMDDGRLARVTGNVLKGS